MDDEDDAFLYGDSSALAAVPPPTTTNIAAAGEEILDFELDEPPYETPPRTQEELPEVAAAAPLGLGLPGEQAQPLQEEPVQVKEGHQDDEEEEEEEEEEDSEDDIEIITEAPTRSIDFRATRGPGGVPIPPPRAPLPPSQTRPVHLTTEYTIKARPTETGQTPGLAPAPTPIPAPPPSLSQTAQPPVLVQERQTSQDVPSQHQTPQLQQIQPLPELLPDPVRAPASHPSLDPSAPGLLVVPGTLQARPVWEVDLDSLSTKSWRRPGANLSDWFNYGFDEISWETYCMRRKELGETASGLKANVLNVAGLPEDQLLNLPPDMRSVVLGTAAMLPLPGQGGPNANMMMPPNAGGAPGVNGKRMVSGPGPGMSGPQAMGPGPGMGVPQGMGPNMGGWGWVCQVEWEVLAWVYRAVLVVGAVWAGRLE
ncbi:cleavage polyadenylation factor subunit fip1 [Ceratobasidium sp. 428]|nr:cleavage polyadenylation factor subunit fip1 [Ceratobasidium sp. 428]